MGVVLVLVLNMSVVKTAYCMSACLWISLFCAEITLQLGALTVCESISVGNHT